MPTVSPLLWSVGLALAGSAGPTPPSPPPPRLLVMHADTTVPGGWWVEEQGTGRPLDTLALAKILKDPLVPARLREDERRARIGRIVAGSLAGATFLGGVMLAGAVPWPIEAGPEPVAGDYDDVDTYKAEHIAWADAQRYADDRDEILTDAGVLLATSALCLAALPLVAVDQPRRLRHPALVWENGAAVDAIEAYNRSLRASLELTPTGARVSVELP